MGDARRIYFDTNGREPYALPDGLYEGVIHHEGDPPGRSPIPLRRAVTWTHGDRARLFPRDKILWVRRIGDLPE